LLAGRGKYKIKSRRKNKEKHLMNTLTSPIHRHPLPAYFILAYAFAWAFAPLIAISPLYGLPGLFAPALAGIIVSGVTGSRAQVSEFLGKLMIWRVSLVWYLIALGLPVMASFLVAVLGRIFGGDPVLQPAPITPLAVVVFILVVGEELGWRGFAQPQLEKSHSPLIAAVILGVLWGLWHLPNFFIPGLPHYEIPLPAFVVYTTALSVIAAWLLKHTSGSVLIATLLHGATNTFGFLTPNLDATTRWWLIAGIYAAAAFLIAILHGAQLHRSQSTVRLDSSQAASIPPEL
jgi:membrane protease YdiL (CAAX protease family)